MSLPYVSDSRRLTGASLVLPVPGAILEVAAPPELKTKLRVLWRHSVKRLLTRIGWHHELVVTRDQGPSHILAISAPIDGLLAATHVTEWAWEAALTRMGLAAALPINEITDRVLSRIVRGAQPDLAALFRAAQLRRIPSLLSEKELSLGEGANCKVYPFSDLPMPEEIAWRPKKRRIPIALVTGTNGKTTTVRLLARMFREAGSCVGFCSTDYVQIGAEVLARDDYSGPTGARLVLRHPDTEAAVLEVARGGMLRRGLQVQDADVGIVTNVADDHLGENGIHTLAQLAEAKFTILRGLRRDAPVVVNADDVYCRDFARRIEHPIFWFGLQRPAGDAIRARKGRAGLCYVANGELVREFEREREVISAVAKLPIAFAGAALYNVANALAACAAASALALPLVAIRAALHSFGLDPADNPGRANIYAINGAQVLIDYGHNPDGVAAILSAATGISHQRLLIGTGLPGDRSDEAAQQIGALVAQAKPQRVIVKEMAMYLRGRPEGQLSGILRASLKQHGHSVRKTGYVRSEVELLDATLAWLKPGDLAVLFLHENVPESAARLSALAETSRAPQ